MAKIRIKNNMLYNEDGVIIATLTDHITEEEEVTLEVAFEAMPIIKKFVDDVNSGSMKPRATVRDLENILNRYK